MKITITIISIFSLVGFFILNGCQKRQEDTATNIEEIEFPDQEGWNSTVTSTKNGIVSAIIQYEHMQQFKKRKVVEFDGGIVIDFFDEQGIHTSNLTSKKGRLDEATNNIEAFSNVVVVSDTGITLKTERVWWDNSREKIISDQFVTIITADDDTIQGDGFESDQNLENWIILGKDKGRGKLSKGVDLNFELSRKKQTLDTTSIQLLIDKPDTITDTSKVNK